MAHAQNIFETYAETTRTAFDYWISFFPTAPMFGVEWRFGEFAVGASNFEASAPVTETTAEVIDIKTQKPTDAVEEAVEIVEEATAPIETPELFDAPPTKIDTLTDIKGVGPGLEKQLHALGIYTFAQLADLNDAQLAWLDENLMTVKGRCIRDDWSGQAKALMG